MPAKERPMLLSTDMVVATLEDRKTKTRRIISVQPDNECYFELKVFAGILEIDYNQGDKNPKVKCPYGQPGDLLWVRESHYRYGHWRRNGITAKGHAKWAFVPYDDDVRYHDNPPEYFAISRDKKNPISPRWYKRLGRFMPKSAARLWLQITDIRVEQLQDISDKDSQAEGIQTKTERKKSGRCTFYKDYCNQNDWYWSPKASFMSLWQKINGRESWHANPWVWVISFKVLASKPKPK